MVTPYRRPAARRLTGEEAEAPGIEDRSPPAKARSRIGCRTGLTGASTHRTSSMPTLLRAAL